MRPIFLLGWFCCFCTQAYSQSAFSNVAIKFPDDLVTDHCQYSLAAPVFYNPDSVNLVVTYEDVPVESVPDACFKFDRYWYIYDADFYDPSLGCTNVPNPFPSPILTNPLNRPGPIVSAPGTLSPWNPTVVKIYAGDPQATDYSVFYTGGTYKTISNGVLTPVTVPAITAVNCFRYQQTVKIIDTKAPVLQDCPTQSVVINDSSQNDPDLWNASYWPNPFANGNDLDESAVDLSITATDSCGLDARYLLFLDLDNNGVAETVINSNNLPPAGHVYFGNALLPNYQGGELREFDQQPGSDSSAHRFWIYRSFPYNNATGTFSVRWITQQNPALYTLPELPAGTHKIKWFFSDPCGNESVCEHSFTISNQTTATGQAAENAGFQLFPNSPNPFSEATWIRFQLPETTTATLEIRDLSGRLVFTKTEQYAAGLQSIRLTESALPTCNGPLFCSLRTAQNFAVITLLRM